MEEKEEEALGKSYVGSVCKVLSNENKCYFVGKIGEYDAECDNLKVVPYRGDLISHSVQYDTPIKLQVQNKDQIILLYGMAKGQSREYWKVQVVSVENHEDQREGFRQMLDGTGYVYGEWEPDEKKSPCKLVDISLTGILIYSDRKFFVGDNIVITDGILHPTIPTPYTLTCVVCRSFEERVQEEDKAQQDGEEQETGTPRKAKKLQLPGGTYYGCMFQRLPSSTEDRLYKDIFQLQQHERKSDL